MECESWLVSLKVSGAAEQEQQPCFCRLLHSKSNVQILTVDFMCLS